MSLLFPLGLAALAAWLLPLALHLARREQRTLTDFAALRWLAIRAKPRQRLRFDEIALLAVRLALVAAIALLLARPAVTGGGDAHPWEVFHPAVPVPMVDGSGDGERRWLADGFPPVETPPPATDVATASLLRQLDAEMPAGARLTVHVPAVLDGLDGARPVLSRAVTWRVGGLADPVARPAPRSAATPMLAVRHDAAHAAAAAWLRAVAIAWRSGDPVDAAAGEPAATPDIAPLDAPLPADGAVVAWLAAGALPEPALAYARRGGTLLLSADAGWPGPAPGAVMSGDDGAPIAEAAAFGDGRIVRLRRALRPAAWPALLEPTFPGRLRALVAASAPPPARADAATHAPVAGGAGFEPPPREFPAVLAWLVLALFAAERWLATGRRQAPHA